MDDEEERLTNEIKDIEKNIKEWRDSLKAVLDNSDKENPLYPIVNELHESVSRLNSRLSEYRVGKFTLEDCNDAIKEYAKLGEEMKEVYESYKKLNER